MSLVGLAATQAHANPISVTSVALPYNETVTITAPGLNVTAYTGQIELTTSIGLLDVWCIDLYHDIGVGNVGSLKYQFGTIRTDFDGTTLTKTQIAEITGLVATGNSLMASSPSNVLSAAIQMAIWSVEFSSLSFSGVPADTVALDLPLLGLTSTPMNALEIAHQLVSDASSLRGNGETFQSLEGTQSFATLATDVPEPATLVLLAGGLVALAGIRQARRS
jgi:PEP-CTERM motif